MDIFLLVLRYAAGPLLGALIGYCTNWLAVRMLFRPYYAKKIGRLRVPFTPGIIPKRQSALAAAMGKAVGEQLLTGEDLAEALSSDRAKQAFVGYAEELWYAAGEKTARQLVGQLVPEDRAQAFEDAAQTFAEEKIFAAVQRVDLGALVAREGAAVIREKRAALGMLGMLLSDDLIASVTEKLGAGVNSYVEQHGREAVAEAVRREIDGAFSAPLASITEQVEKDAVRAAAAALYDGAVRDAAARLAGCIDVAAIVEKKINAMDVKELEKLVLSVMKRELNAIVNLGALIGLLLGIVMIFI